MKYPHRENAVSPVIATVLMISITVVIAALTAAFTLGFAQTTSDSKVVAVIATDYTPTEVTFTIHGGNNVQDLTALDIFQGDTITPWVGLTPQIGDTFTLPISSPPMRVIGTFNDGTRQVLWIDNVKPDPTPPPIDKTVVVNPIPLGAPFGGNYLVQYTFSGSGTGNIQTTTAIDVTGATVLTDSGPFSNGPTYWFVVTVANYPGSHVDATFTDGSTETLYTWP
jgi:flagellin-like protein